PFGPPRRYSGCEPLPHKPFALLARINLCPLRLGRCARSSARRKIVRGWPCEVEAGPLRGRSGTQSLAPRRNPRGLRSWDAMGRSSAQRKFIRGLEQVAAICREVKAFESADAYGVTTKREVRASGQIEYTCFAVEPQAPSTSGRFSWATPSTISERA